MDATNARNIDTTDTRFGDAAGFQPLLEVIPVPAFLLDEERRTVAVNRRARSLLHERDLSEILGRRPGDLLNCVNARLGPDACGETDACLYCGANRSIRGALSLSEVTVEECRIRIDENGGVEAYEFEVQSSLLQAEGRSWVIVALRDISAEKRRSVLERVFFHDVLNTASGIHGLAEFIAREDNPEVVRRESREIAALSGKMIDEIEAQRQLIAAENRELRTHVSSVRIAELVSDVIALYRRHPIAEGREMTADVPPDLRLCTDERLLRRVLINLVKNALEATPPGGTVTVWAARVVGTGGTRVPEGRETKEWKTGDPNAADGGEPMDVVDDGTADPVEIVVGNPGVMPAEVQRQMFQRSFSTKGGSGRGVGTYSVKLFVETCLKGWVSFTSTPETGTRFIVWLPPLDPPDE